MTAAMLRRRGIAITGLALLSSCAAIPNDRPTGSPLDAVTSGLTANATSEAFVAAGWWTSIGDPQLDRIMADALADSPSIAAAQARLRAAEASIDYQRAGLGPQIAGDAQETRQRFSDKYIIPPTYAGTSRWVGTAQAGLSWSLDLAGRQKAVVDAAGSNASTAALDVEAARITLSGAVAQTYVNLRRAYVQADIASRFAASRADELRLAQSRRRNKLGSDFDIRTAETLLAEARQAGIRADGERAMMVHALAALAGRGPDYYPTIASPRVDLERGIAVPDAIPADLLGRRPDILAARARISVADANRRVARADFFPNVDLKAFLGVSAIGLGSMFSGGAATYGAGPALHLPIFQSGRLRAGYRQTLADQDASIASYNEIVIRAVREVADALTAIDANARVTEQQAEVARGLAETVRLDEVRVRSGLSGRLDVLDAQDRQLAATQKLADLRADGAGARIKLLIAVGGGFPALVGERSQPARTIPLRR